MLHAGEVDNGHVLKLVRNPWSTAQRPLSSRRWPWRPRTGPARKAVEIGFTLGPAHKDVRLAYQLGTDSGMPMFFDNVTRELYETCIAEMGRDNQVDTHGQSTIGYQPEQTAVADPGLQEPHHPGRG